MQPEDNAMSVINEPAGELTASIQASAVLDDAHVGHIHGAFGTILHGDHAPRIGWQAHIKTLLAILGPGLIVMVGDNDAGAFGTYTQAGQVAQKKENSFWPHKFISERWARKLKFVNLRCGPPRQRERRRTVGEERSRESPEMCSTVFGPP
jgi:hypothetical protein